VEPLQRLTRRQLEALRLIAAQPTEGRGVPLNAIARGLGVRAPSALAHLGPLEELALIARSRGKSRVTERGRTCLDEYLRHHRVAESLFAAAGLSAAATHAAALEVDLALSHRTVEEICEAEGHPKVCPHGNPIAPCSAGEPGRPPGAARAPSPRRHRPQRNRPARRSAGPSTLTLARIRDGRTLA
jgi:Mn-dependent DtxR family transcriptional regulator